MKCVSCQKEISVGAKVCPYCQRDTSDSAAIHFIGLALVLGGGFLGWQFGGFKGAFWTVVVALVVFIGIVIVIAFQKDDGARVKVDGEATAPTPEPTSAESKKCPRCAETVKVEAVYCRYCHSDI